VLALVTCACGGRNLAAEPAPAVPECPAVFAEGHLLAATPTRVFLRRDGEVTIHAHDRSRGMTRVSIGSRGADPR